MIICVNVNFHDEMDPTWTEHILLIWSSIIISAKFRLSKELHTL